MTFENLKGLRAEAYVRDSTLDQRDGFGPDLQRRNIHRFADSYELALGDRLVHGIRVGPAGQEQARVPGVHRGRPRG